ncbi:DUF1549 domain-containing protein [Luteolibacter marinus]|uniref:DUF1549 domain-containing protein n=1 Tax=Luteolibacter marinus TaxID=2776705 RepID=UPI0018694EDF|nr:DUF1549 domain-containing protein [Luteolibacter marinus]
MFTTPRLLALTTFVLTPLAAWSKPLPEATVEQAAARIDSLLEADLKRAGSTPNPRVDDATFLRRAYLGIVGRIPSEAEALAFLDDRAGDKRSALVDRLVASPGFDSHLFNWTADLLRVQTRQEQFGLGWHVWLRQSLAGDTPWDQLVSEMLGATGHCVTDPAVGYYLRDRNMQLDNFSNSMQVFLGRQIGCAQCHDHPFDTWTQYDYYQMAAFGGGIEYRSKEAQDLIRKTVQELSSSKTAANGPREIKAAGKNKNAEKKRRRELQRANKTLAGQFRPIFKDFNKNAILDDPGAMLKLPDDYQYRDGKPGEIVAAETLFGEKISGVAPEDRRETFAAWVTSPDNPYFTKVIANRLWARTFGHGLVDPVDDWSEDTVPSHPEVLAYLDTTMKGVGYDLRQFLRILYRTRLFERECLDEEPAMGMPLAFRGPTLTRMSAEQLHDSFLVLTRSSIDDSPTPAFTKSWDAYRQQVTNLLNAETRDLVLLGESARQGEKLLREAQAGLRAAQKARAVAGTPAERSAAQAEFQHAREEFLAARKQADPLRAMQMGKRAGARDNNGSLRASEHPAPFNPGSLVREFGGSDRQTPSSSDTTATVPQALALLNNPKTDIVAGKKSMLGRQLANLKTPRERLDCLFLTLFSQRPDAAEQERFLPLAKDPTALRDLARAMMTSNRFLFIQ